jgi:tRNA threonylcarbamoyladenosine biosynthesis protein TsaE
MDLIYKLEQTDQIAAQLVKKYANQPVWVFQAPMGAGKTTLIAAIGKALGIQEAMSSPTFSIMNEYEVHGKLIYHMDWYRLESEAEARQAGVEAAMEEADLSLVEWPEKAPNLVPEFAVVLHIEILDPAHRRIYIQNKKEPIE